MHYNTSFKYNKVHRSRSVDCSPNQLPFPRPDLRKVASTTGTTQRYDDDPCNNDDHDDDSYKRNKQISSTTLPLYKQSSLLRSLSNNNKNNKNHDDGSKRNTQSLLRSISKNNNNNNHGDNGNERNKRILLRSLSNNNNNNHKKKRTTKLNILSGHTIIILCLLLSTIMFTKVLLLTYHIRMRRKHQRSYHGMTFHEQLTNLNVLQSSLFDSLYYQRHSNRTFTLHDRREWFPCHYYGNREEEYLIEPFYNQTLQTATTTTTRSSSSTANYEYLQNHTITNGKKHDISIITMMSPKQAMFDHLLSLTENWSGAISVALFVNSKKERDTVEVLIQDFYDTFRHSKKKQQNGRVKVYLSNADRIDNSDNNNSNNNSTENKHQKQSGRETKIERVNFHLVTDLDQTIDRGYDVNVFPRNVLRNVAIDYTYTTHVLILDIDFVISENAHKNIKNQLMKLDKQPNIFGQEDKKHALVVPAFEVDIDFNQTLAKNKRELREKKNNGTPYTPFLRKTKLKAHQATDYPRWYTKYKTLYPVEGYHPDYEPYVVIKKDTNLPPFWEHFTGFGRNKLEWIEELYLSGYQFLVIPDCFIVHKNHENYGLRRVRPYIADEYFYRFQKYIKDAYGRHIQDMWQLWYWKSNTNFKWSRLKAINKTATTSDEFMKQTSMKREGEFQSCMNALHGRDYKYRTGLERIHYYMKLLWVFVFVFFLIVKLFDHQQRTMAKKQEIEEKKITLGFKR